jgi:hypothetical protein
MVLFEEVLCQRGEYFVAIHGAKVDMIQLSSIIRTVEKLFPTF